VTTANVFWWYNMYSTADFSITPRPMYLADGRKLPDIYTAPSYLRDRLQEEIGQFPLFEFWGPRASIASTEWIAESAKRIEERFSPTLTFVYLPHLDYNLQRVGPSDPAAANDISQVDDVCGDLLAFYEARDVQPIVLSEYGLTDVDTPVHLNRILRMEGLLAVREERGLELLDPGASAAFAVADHQVAHVYVNDPREHTRVREILEHTRGVDQVLDSEGKAAYRIDHPRAGEFVAIAAPHAWFTYYYWMEDLLAPDFARTVDIHRKPGYDPVELFVDPTLTAPALTIGVKLAMKSLGFRTLLDVIPLDATLVKGSHGRPAEGDDGPLLISRQKAFVAPSIDSVDVFSIILQHLGVSHEC
jgi:predicted AlkP superfamily pyrophosphatase or phosphodiesterase